MPERDMKSTVLDVAERMIRLRGYNGVSFREIADDIGIKSASVHYHFPTKGALGVAVAARYTQRFMQILGPADDMSGTVSDVQSRVHKLSRKSLMEDDMMCLCGILGAEVADLPEEVRTQTRRFFEMNVDWLTRAFAGTDWGQNAAVAEIRSLALSTLATSEGAMLLARAMGDRAVFDQIDLPAP